jgi:hypothetical protein
MRILTLLEKWKHLATAMDTSVFTIFRWRWRPRRIGVILFNYFYIKLFNSTCFLYEILNSAYQSSI